MADEHDTESTLHEHARDCIETAIEAAHPDTVLADHLSLDGSTLAVDGVTVDLSSYEHLYVVGGGNAAGTAAKRLESTLGDRIDDGVVVTDAPVDTERITVYEGTHPLPSERNVEATEAILDVTDAAGADDLVLTVIAGGGSALLTSPATGIPLLALRTVTADLLDSGAAIDEINAVRKHCSNVKGGQLARTAAPARVVSLVFSDVVGNRLDVVASGPTAPDTTTYRDALDVFERYDVTPDDAIAAHLSHGANGDRAETPKPGDEIFERVSNVVVADAHTAISAAATTAADHGYEPLILTSRVRGEAREAAKVHVAIAEEAAATGNPIEPPAALLSGGETTVTVTGDGYGGPNLEFALSSALELDTEGIVVGSVDTDGFDGDTGVAGATVDRTFVDAADGAEARAALADNDAGSVFAGHDELVQTGATGTNVNDLRIVLVDERSDDDGDGYQEDGGNEHR